MGRWQMRRRALGIQRAAPARDNIIRGFSGDSAPSLAD